MLGLLATAFYVAHTSNQRKPEKTSAQQTPNVSTSTAAFSSARSAPRGEIRNYHSAEGALFGYLGIPLSSETRPCGKHLPTRLECKKLSLHSWTEITELNRPVILTMTTPEKFSTYLVLIGLNTDTGFIINEKQQTLRIPLAEIGRDWTGEVVYLWKKPPAFTETLFLGDSSPTIAWLAQQFAKIDKQLEPLSDDLLSLALQERIKIFQQSNNIPMDGNINEQTLMKINEVIGTDKTLITDFPVSDVVADLKAPDSQAPGPKASGASASNPNTAPSMEPKSKDIKPKEQKPKETI